MGDLVISQDEYGCYDLVIENGNLKRSDSFETPILMSLLTDGRNNNPAIPQEKRRGWLGDVFNKRNIGSLLYTVIEQGRLNQATLNKAIEAARKSLDWFIEDGLILKIEVAGNIVPRQGILLSIVYTSLTGQVTNQYIKTWENTANAS